MSSTAPLSTSDVLDLVLGLTSGAVSTAAALGRQAGVLAGPVARPVVRAALRPVLVPPGRRPATWVGSLVATGGRRRDELRREVGAVLDRAVPAVADELLRRIDLAALAAEVIAAVDLPEIIRDATGAVTSETVRGMRMRGIAGDEALVHVTDRFRRGHPAPRVRPP